MDDNPQNLTVEGPSGLSAPIAPKNRKAAPSDSTSTLQLPLTIAQWEKNSREVFRVSLSQYKGRALVDCRIFYQAEGGNYLPSPKGISVTLDHLPAMADGFSKALVAARRAGLVEGGET